MLIHRTIVQHIINKLHIHGHNEILEHIAREGKLTYLIIYDCLSFIYRVVLKISFISICCRNKVIVVVRIMISYVCFQAYFIPHHIILGW